MQFGFREGKSTIDAILKLSSFVYDKVHKRISTIGTFLDLSKVYSLSPTYFSYLLARKQEVKIKII